MIQATRLQGSRSHLAELGQSPVPYAVSGKVQVCDGREVREGGGQSGDGGRAETLTAPSEVEIRHRSVRPSHMDLDLDSWI